MRRAAKVFLALVVGGVAGVSGDSAGLSAPHPSPGAENVGVYWMSGVIENDRACVGVLGLHGNNAYDLIADDSGPCYGPSSTQVNLRALTYSSTPHVTLGAHMWSGSYQTNLCDYIEARTVQYPSGDLRGTYRYIHAQGGSDYWVDIWAGPTLPETDAPIGSTTDDSDCTGGWTGYHTHQDAVSPYSQPNSLAADDDIPVWNVSYYIHRWIYPLPDTDGDDFNDAAELYMGTDPFDDCPDGWWDAAWPPDFDNNTVVDVFDAIAFLAHFPSAPGDPRYDMNADGVIDVLDALIFLSYFPSTCA